MSPFVHVVWPAVVGGVELEATATTVSDTIQETHAVNLPSGLAAGKLAVLIAREGRTPGGMYTPSDWTLLMNTSTTARVSVFYRVCDGTEGSTVNVTVHDGSEGSATARLVAVAYRVGGALLTGDFIEGAHASSGEPPLLTPSWGSAANLWLAAYTSRYGDWSVTAVPTNYALAGEAITGSGEDNAYGIVGASRVLTAASEQPGPFSIAAGENGLVVERAMTIAVRPA